MSAQIAHNTRFIPATATATLPPEAFKQSYPDASVVAAIQQSNARLALMIAQTQQQMEQLQLFQAYQKANQYTSAPPPPPFAQVATAAAASSLDEFHVNNTLEGLPESFTSARQASTSTIHPFQSATHAPSLELGQVEGSHKLSFPPGLPFAIYTKAPERRLAQGPESDPAVIASFRKAPAAVFPPFLPQESKDTNPTKPTHSKLESIDAAQRRVEQAIEVAKQQSAKTNVPLPPKPDQHPLSNRLLGIIPSAVADNRRRSVNTDAVVAEDHSVDEAMCNDTSRIAAARRRVRSNAPSPEDMHTPVKYSGAISSAPSNAVSRSAPLRAPLPKTQPSRAVPTSDPKPRRYTASMNRSDAPQSRLESEEQDKKAMEASRNRVNKERVAHASVSKTREQPSKRGNRSGRGVNGGWTDFVEKMGGVPSKKD
jgi:hypothetical protein